MTDPTPDDTDPRAEQAFRDALQPVGRHAASPVRALRPYAAGRPWLWLVVAAAAVAVVAGSSAVARGLRADDPTGPDHAPPPPAPRRRPPTRTATARDVRTVVYRDVAVAVPAAWATIPTRPTNVVRLAGRAGFVDGAVRRHEASAAGPLRRPTIGCYPTGDAGARRSRRATERLWVPHLSLLARRERRREPCPTGPRPSRAGPSRPRTVGDVRRRAAHRRSDYRRRGREILDFGAARSTTDDNGCDTTSPVQAAGFVRPPAFDVSSAVDSVTVDRGVPVRPRVRTPPGCSPRAELQRRRRPGRARGDPGRRRRAAVPTTRRTARRTLFGDQAIVLRLRDGDCSARRPLRLLRLVLRQRHRRRHDAAGDHGGRLRPLCSPGPVFQQIGGDGSTFELCHPETR